MAKLIDITGKAISGEWGTDDLVGNGVPVLRTTNFTNIGVVNFNNVVTRQIVKKSISEKLLRYGDIIIEKSGGSDKQPVGRVVFFEGEENKYLFNNFTGLLRVRDFCEWNPKYIFYSLFANYAKGGTIPFENRTTGLHNLQTDSYVNNVMIVERKIEEQTDIVTILDKVNQLINYEKKQLEDLDILVKSRFIEMFGDPVINSKGWITKRLPELGTLSRGMSKHRPRNAPELLGGPYPLIQTGDVANADGYIKEYTSTYSELGFRQSKMWPKGTLCITIAANIAKTAILEFASCFPDSIVGFNAYSAVTNEYIHHWFTFVQRIIEEQAPESAQKNINMKILSDLKVMVPDKNIQHEYVDFLKQVDKSKLAIQQSLDELETLKKSLMQQYFG